MKCLIVLSIFFLFFISGCVETEILDDIAIEMARSYDLIEEKKVQGTMLINNIRLDKSIENTTYSTIATTSREMSNNLQKKSPQPLSEGSIEVILYGKTLASNGLKDYLDAPLRNASIGARLFFVVVDGNGQDLLSGNYGDRGNAIYISELLNHNIKQEDMPKTNLQLFIHDFYQQGKTEFLPQIKKVDDTTLELNGISLFKSDQIRAVDTIEPKNMFFFKLLVDKYSKGSHKIPYNGHYAVLRSIRSDHKMKLTKREPYKITAHIKIKGILREYTGPNNLTHAMIRKIEKKIEEETTKECEALLKRFQKQKIDPVGLGFFIKTKTRGFDLKNWEDGNIYQSLQIKVKTDVNIVESGVIE